MKEKKERKFIVLFFPFFFWPRCAAYAISVSQPGIKPTPPALEDEILATGLAGKPQAFTLGAYMLSTLYPLLRLSALDHSRTETQLSLGLSDSQERNSKEQSSWRDP